MLGTDQTAPLPRKKVCRTLSLRPLLSFLLCSFLCFSLPSRNQHCGSTYWQTDQGKGLINRRIEHFSSYGDFCGFSANHKMEPRAIPQQRPISLPPPWPPRPTCSISHASSQLLDARSWGQLWDTPCARWCGGNNLTHQESSRSWVIAQASDKIFRLMCHCGTGRFYEPVSMLSWHNDFMTSLVLPREKTDSHKAALGGLGTIRHQDFALGPSRFINHYCCFGTRWVSAVKRKTIQWHRIQWWRCMAPRLA